MLRFAKVFAVSATIVFFIGCLSEVWCSQEWLEVGPGGGGALRDFAFDPSESDRVYLTSDMVGVFVSDDAGDNWKWSSYGAAKQKGGIAVDLSNPDILYTVGSEGVFQSKDKAKHWQLIYSKGNGYTGINNESSGILNHSIFGRPGQSISVSPTGVVYVGTVTGDLIISRDKGKSFKRIPVGGKSAVRIIIPIDEKKVVAALYTDGVYLSRDEGLTWENTMSSANGSLLALAVHPVRSNVLYALTSKHSTIFKQVKTSLPCYLYKSIDGGASWKLVQTFEKLTVRKGRRLMDISKEGTIIILAQRPMRSIDGGLKWSYPEYVIKEDDGFIYATRYKWSGNKWSVYADHRKTGRWYMAAMGAALRSDDDGRTWYYKVNGLREQACFFIRVNPANPNLVIASDMDHGLIRSSDGGITWKNDFIIDAYEECDQLRFSPNDDTYKVLYSFFILPYPFIAKSTDAGETWSVLKSWKEKKRRSMNDFCLTTGNEFPVMYVGEPNVGIWKSTDEGKSWTKKNKGLPRPEEMNYIQFLESDTRGYLYVGIPSGSKGKGGIYRSVDGGETWVPINKGLHKFVRRGSFEIDPNDPDVLWVSAGRAVYRSKNSGLSWEKRIDGVKSSAILVEPGNSDIVYVASFTGGGVLEQFTSGIFKSVDGGNYFFEISGDLLRTIGSTYRVFDLEYGWRGSGGIWAAPDGGGLIYTIQNQQ